jgi:hypothetical protein
MLGADTGSGRLSLANLDQMQQCDDALREGAGTLYQPAAGGCTRRFPGPSLEGSIRAATAAAPSADGGGNAAGLAQPTGACVPPAGDGGML